MSYQNVCQYVVYNYTLLKAITTDCCDEIKTIYHRLSADTKLSLLEGNFFAQQTNILAVLFSGEVFFYTLKFLFETD